MIAPQVFALTVFLSVMWGIYLLLTIREWWGRVRRHERRSGEIVASFRRMIVALNLWLIIFSFVFRTGMVLLGFGTDLVGQIVFYALAGTNVLGSIVAVLTYAKPRWFE